MSPKRSHTSRRLITSAPHRLPTVCICCSLCTPTETYVHVGFDEEFVGVSANGFVGSETSPAEK
jgi:hypothetical protein